MKGPSEPRIDWCGLILPESQSCILLSRQNRPELEDIVNQVNQILQLAIFFSTPPRRIFCHIEGYLFGFPEES